MKLAITYENGEIFQHFGHSEQFKLYTIENGEITASEVVNTSGSGHSALAGFLRENGVQALICGGIGGGAVAALNEAKIALYAGNSGNADDASGLFVSGKLKQSAVANCSHHEHEHTSKLGTHAHSCGGHGCGKSCHD